MNSHVPNAYSIIMCPTRPDDEPSIWSDTRFSKNFMSMIQRQQRPYYPDIVAHAISMINLLKIYRQVNDLNRRISYNFSGIDVYQNVFFLHSTILNFMASSSSYFTSIDDFKSNLCDRVLPSSHFAQSVALICMLTRLHYNSYRLPREYAFPLNSSSPSTIDNVNDGIVLAPSAHSTGIIIYCLTGLSSIIMHFQGDSDTHICSPLFVHGEASAVEIFQVTALAATVFTNLGNDVSVSEQIYVYRSLRFVLVPCIRSMSVIWPFFIPKVRALEKKLDLWLSCSPYLTNQITG